MIGEYQHGTLAGSIEDAIAEFRVRHERAFLAADRDSFLLSIGRMAELILTASDDLTSKGEAWDRADLWRAFRKPTDIRGFGPTSLRNCRSRSPGSILPPLSEWLRDRSS
jgi:hypothetical protein